MSSSSSSQWVNKHAHSSSSSFQMTPEKNYTESHTGLYNDSHHTNVSTPPAWIPVLRTKFNASENSVSNFLRALIYSKLIDQVLIPFKTPAADTLPTGPLIPRLHRRGILLVQ